MHDCIVVVAFVIWIKQNKQKFARCDTYDESERERVKKSKREWESKRLEKKRASQSKQRKREK